jgi:hypothetical protein
VVGGIVAGALIGSFSGVGAFITSNILTGTNPVQPAGGSINSQVHSSFIIDASNPDAPLTEGGLLGDLFDSGRLTVDPQSKTATWKQTGDIELAFTPDPSGTMLHIDGHLGTVEAHLQVNQMDEQLPKDAVGVCTHGTLGGLPYMVDSVFTMDTTLHGSETNHGQIVATGRLGDAEISKRYDLTMAGQGGKAQLTANGQGVVAGVPVQITVEAHTAQK